MVMKFFKRLFHSRDKPKDLFTGGSIFRFGRSSSGQTVNEKTAMQMSAVYACVRIIAEAIAQIPLNVYRLTADGGKEKDLRHPLFFLLHDEPNPEMTSFIFRETLMSHLLLWGNAYAQIIRNGKGEVVGLYPLMPDRMQVDRNETGNLVYTYTKYYDEVGAKHAFEQITLPAYQVLHIPGLGYNGLIGYSPIAMARNAIGMSMAAEDFGATFFANGATPGGVLEHPGIVKDPERLRESWHAQFSGKNSHNIAVLEEGVRPDGRH
jgi:HK97 family phage portal protein